MITWFFLTEGNAQKGPFSADEIRAKIDLGQIRPDTLVWREGMADWLPASATELASAFVTPPPPMGFAAGAGSFPPVAPRDREPAMQTGPGHAAPPRSFGAAISTCFSEYVTFSGRASRSEFWYWVLFTFIGGVVFELVSPEFGWLFSLATFLPGLAVGARRLHDIGRSGWWQLLSFIPIIGWIVLIVWFATRGVVEQTPYD